MHPCGANTICGECGGHDLQVQDGRNVCVRCGCSEPLS